MFDKTTDQEEETSFSEAYRSEILNKGKTKEESIFPKLFSIVSLVILISAISIFGYNYINKETTTTVVEKEVVIEPKVQKEASLKEIVEELPLPSESMMIDDIAELDIIEAAQAQKINPTPMTSKSDTDIDQIANQMKLELAKELDMKSDTPSQEQEQETTLLTPQKQKGEEIYMEQLRELSDEIDRERK
ncbi:MAG: hypothetical protein KAG56_08955 [Sulfurovaceae bacterium]|nr:hypothetical protein [Sulfurovaceae bacterium]